MSTTVREVRKEAARASYTPRLKTLYEGELRARLQDELELSSVMGEIYFDISFISTTASAGQQGKPANNITS